MKTRFFIPIVALFFSGFSALVLEVVWARISTLILGSTTVAATIVFSTFMAGLAIGAFLSARLLHALKRPFLLYVVIEFATAVIAIVISFFWSTWGGAFYVSRSAVVIGLLVPTVLMGMTVPLVVAGLVRLGAQANLASAWCYGVNTVGGAVGALAGAFWLLPSFGLFVSQWFAGGGLLLAAACCSFLAPLTVEPYERRSFSVLKIFGGTKPLILCIAFWGGASSLSLEIISTRLFALILGPSVYALGIVLFVYLLGIAAGALLCPTILKRLNAVQTVAACLLLLGFSVGWIVMAIGLLPYLYVWLVETIQPAIESLRMIEFVLAAIAMAPAAILHGVLLPTLMALYPDQEIKGRPIALTLGWNTAGAIFGTVATGLVTIPAFGLLPTLLFLLVTHIVFGAIYLLFSLRDVPMIMRQGVVVLGSLFVIVFLLNARGIWDRSVLASGVYKYAVGDALGAGGSKIEIGKILFYREGISSTVAVIETADDRVLSIDGKADASIYGDRSTQVLLGALPGSLAQRAEKFLVIGFASGVTAGVSASFPEARVVAVEIEPAVYQASEYFLSVNLGPLEPPEHLLLEGDARRFLYETDEQYDVITSEPSNPWMSGVAPLFTEEFFRLSSKRIRKGGVMCQWLPIYGMTKDLVASVMKTFSMVFPHVLVFESVEGYDLLMIGSHHKILLDPRSVERRWTGRELDTELAAIEIDTGLDLVARFLMGNKGVSRFSDNAVMNTDDNGYVEFGAPKALHLKTAKMNNRYLSEASEGILSYLSENARERKTREDLSERFKRRGEFRLAESVLE